MSERASTRGRDDELASARLRPEHIDVAAWRKAMEGATPDSWFVSGVRFRMGGCEWQGVNRYDEANKRDYGVACVSIDPRTGAGLKDAAWIARCSPAGVSALLDEIERLRGLVSESEAHRYRACGELLARVEAAEQSLKPLARLKVPWKPVGNAGAYSILFDDIRRAQSVLESRSSCLADATPSNPLSEGRERS